MYHKAEILQTLEKQMASSLVIIIVLLLLM